MQREYAYAKTIRHAAFAGARIERILVTDTMEERIRFGAWQGNMLHRRALDIGEDELLVLIGDAVAARVFSASFLTDVEAVLINARKGHQSGS